MSVMEDYRVAKAGAGEHREHIAKVGAQIMANLDDPEYRLALEMALVEHNNSMIEYHQVELQALLDQAAQGTHRRARRAFMRAAIKKRLVEVIKEEGFDPQKQRRNADGRFGSRIGAKVQGSTDVLNDGKTAEDSLAAMVEGLDIPDNRKARVSAQFTIINSSGEVRTVIPPAGKVPKVGMNERVMAIKPRGVDKPIYLGDSVFDVANALGMDAGQASMAGGIADDLRNLVRNQGGWGARLVGTSEIASKISTDPSTVIAAKMMRAVGQHGPEATQVLGPHMRRVTYRYRGTEAAAEQYDPVARSGRQSTTRPDGTTEREATQGFEARLAGRLSEKLPSLAQIDVLLKTGSTPPSEGFLLDKNGKVVQQAVGVADDHYIPFNLKQLGRLKGGSYVRSRAFGGPTTEDIYTGLMMGAERVTVVSRNGTFTVNFAGRTGESVSARYGLQQKQMVKRYGKLLDAIQSGKIKDPNDPSTNLKLDGKGYEVALKAMVTQFPYHLKDPQITAAGNIEQQTGTQGYFERDKGYVRPMHLRAHTAFSGYHDERLNGGKPPVLFDDLDGYKFGKARLASAQLRTRDAARNAQLAQERAQREAAMRRTSSFGVSPARPTGGTAATQIRPQQTATEMARDESGRTFMAGPNGTVVLMEGGKGQERKYLEDDELGSYMKYVSDTLTHPNVMANLDMGDRDTQFLFNLFVEGPEDTPEMQRERMAFASDLRTNENGVWDQVEDSLDQVLGRMDVETGIERPVLTGFGEGEEDDVPLYRDASLTARNKEQWQRTDPTKWGRYNTVKSMLDKGTRFDELAVKQAVIDDYVEVRESLKAAEQAEAPRTSDDALRQANRGSEPTDEELEEYDLDMLDGMAPEPADYEEMDFGEKNALYLGIAEQLDMDTNDPRTVGRISSMLNAYYRRFEGR